MANDFIAYGVVYSLTLLIFWKISIIFHISLFIPPAYLSNSDYFLSSSANSDSRLTQNNNAEQWSCLSVSPSNLSFNPDDVEKWYEVFIVG